MKWQDHAACKDEDTELFFPPWPGGQAQTLEAKAVCWSCPVRKECLEWSLRVGQDYGIVGGLTAMERELLKKANRTVQV